MIPQNTFGPLVGHEFNWERQRNQSKRDTSARWAFLYLGIAILVGFSLFTFAVIQEYIEPMYFWYFIFSVPFTAIGLAHNVIYREWKDHTLSWWLLLPYSRIKLISSKFVACLLQMVIISVAVYMLIALLGLYAMLWQGITFSSTLTFLGWGIIWWAFSVSVLPVIVAFGILASIIAYSQLKSMLPLLWILFWLVWGSIIWISALQKKEENMFAFISFIAESQASVYFPFNGFWLTAIFVSWILTYVLLRCSSRLLDRHLNL